MEPDSIDIKVIDGVEFEVAIFKYFTICNLRDFTIINSIIV